MMGHVQSLFQEVNHHVLLQYLAAMLHQRMLGLALGSGVLPSQVHLLLLLLKLSNTQAALLVRS